jgi:hypothetical protein
MSTRFLDNLPYSSREARLGYYKNYYRENAEQKREYGKVRYYRKREVIIAQHKDFRRKIRTNVLEHYAGSPRCACCDESEFHFLTIDHVNGGGAIHRRQGIYGAALYLYLFKNNYPEGYQVLCHNCNFAKWRLGSCPHKKEVFG